ncbi:MAG: hypothetical protein ACYC0V_03490 [Armatimonadota bacterium]
MNTDGTKPKHRSGAKSMGIACLLIIGLIIAIAVMLQALFSWGSTRNHSVPCLSRVKQLGTAIQMYAAENDGMAPLGANWQEALFPYIKSKTMLICPEAKTEDRCYALNFHVQGRNIWVIDPPQNAVMVFESIPGTNQCGSRQLLPSPPRHPEGHSIAFMDGHAKSVKPQEIDSLIWNVKAYVR